MKYRTNFRASLRSAQFFKYAPPNFKSWIRPCYLKYIQIDKTELKHFQCLLSIEIKTTM